MGSGPAVPKHRSLFGRLNANARVPTSEMIEQRKEPDVRPITPIPTQLDNSSTCRPLPKSRTFQVFSSISGSISRSSLVPSFLANNSSTISFGSEIAGVTTVSSSTSNITKGSTSTRVPTSKSSRWSLSSHKSPLEIALPRDPSLVYDAQPSAYWTGRFMSLHDKFQSESLTPKNMQALILAHSNRAAAASQQRAQDYRLQQSRRIRRPAAGLPPSATSSAVLQQMTGDMSGAAAQTEAALLLDEHARCRRIFVHLEAVCATDEARRSLRLWQRDYARKTGRKSLLPKGSVTDEDEGSEQHHGGGSYLSRLLGGKRTGKRASVV